MKIYFCDGCNESIPLTAIQDGTVTTIKGKLFCADCVPKTATAPGAAAASTRGGSSPVLWVLVILLIAWTAYRELGSEAAVAGFGETSQALETSDAAWRLQTLEKDVSQLRVVGEEVTDRLERQRSELDQLRTTIGDATRVSDQLRDEVDAFARGQAETGRLIERATILENRSDYLSDRIDVLAGLINDVAERIGEVSTRVDEAPAMIGIGGGGGRAASADDGSSGEYAELRKRLLDPDASERFDAVSDILDRRLKELAPDLIGVLGDEDAFVKILAMEALGDFGYDEAVEPLFDVLDDPSPQIRKTAAETLIRLTGYDPGYDARGSEAERRRAVDAWVKWLEDDAAR